MNEEQAKRLLTLLEEVFSPSTPIKSRDLFFGRIDQISQVVEGINEPGKHVVLYGERGVGKTSLANIIHTGLTNMLTARITCNRDDNYSSIWRNILREFRFSTQEPGIGFGVSDKQVIKNLANYLPDERPINQTDIISLLRNVPPMLLVFDEFDSIIDAGVKTRFADTLKALSDNVPQVTLLIVGIADSINDLIGNHPSIERCMKQVKLPRMSEEELLAIINNGLDKLSMTIDPAVRNDIVAFSSGFPHYTHLLSKYSARTAISRQSINIIRSDFDKAVNHAVENAQESIRSSYQKAVMSTKKNSIYPYVAMACALVDLDEHGTFRAMDLGPILTKLLNRPIRLQNYNYNLGMLCQAERGQLLKRDGRPKQYRYRFNNPLLRAYLRLKDYQTRRKIS